MKMARYKVKGITRRKAEAVPVGTGTAFAVKYEKQRIVKAQNNFQKNENFFDFSLDKGHRQ